MSQAPTQYTRQANFITDAGSNPFGTPSPVKLDAEFNAVKTSMDQTQSRLGEIQRDDGKLKNGIVTLDNIDTSIVFPGSMVAQDGITNYHLANDAVDTPQIVNWSVTTDKLADNSITDVKIQNGAISIEKVGGLGTALAGKAAASHTHTKAQITDFAHQHTFDDVPGLQGALDARAAVSHTHTKSQITDFAHNHAIADVSGLQTALDGKQVAGSYVTLVNGVVPSSMLPSYVDDVLEYPTASTFPGTGEQGKIYIALDTNQTYRWSGTAYIVITSSPGSTDAIPEGSSNLYYTNARASAAAPVQSVAGKTGAVTLAIADVSGLQTALNNAGQVTSVAGRTGAVTLAKADVGLGNVDNTSDVNKPISTAVQTALDGKQAAGSYAPATGIAPTAITGTAVITTDSRLSDSRTPTAHTHPASEVTGIAKQVFQGFSVSTFDTSIPTFSSGVLTSFTLKSGGINGTTVNTVEYNYSDGNLTSKVLKAASGATLNTITLNYSSGTLTSKVLT
jgi:hypothetical protein